MKKVFGILVSLLTLVPAVAGAYEFKAFPTLQSNVGQIKNTVIKLAPRVTNIDYCADIITVQFSEPMDVELVKTLVEQGHFLVKTTGNLEVAETFLGANSDGTSFVFRAHLEAGLKPYEIVVSGFKSLDGREVVFYVEEANLGHDYTGPGNDAYWAAFQQDCRVQAKLALWD